MEHDGHTWIVSFEKVGCTNLVASWHGRNYTMQQLHFHFESENMLGGHHKDMEVHLVHKAEDGAMLVIGQLLDHSDLGESRIASENGFLTTLFRAGFELDRVTHLSVMDPYSGLMSQGEEFYSYIGSLTTPPCTPNIEWVVLKDPVPITRHHVRMFEGYLQRAPQPDSYGHDDRPVQPLNDRPVKLGTISAMLSV
jgi:carbonic anhydrase